MFFLYGGETLDFGGDTFVDRNRTRVWTEIEPGFT